MQIEKRRLKKPSLFDFLHIMQGGVAAPMALLRGKGGDSLSKENLPLWNPQENARGDPLDPQHWQFIA